MLFVVLHVLIFRFTSQALLSKLIFVSFYDECVNLTIRGNFFYIDRRVHVCVYVHVLMHTNTIVWSFRERVELRSTSPFGFSAVSPVFDMTREKRLF